MPLHTDPLTDLSAAKTLNDGRQIPMLGLGTWELDDGPECESSVRDALNVGYRHIDTALAYKNEASVGKAIRDFGDRDSVWLTSKYMGPNGKQNALDAIDKSLQKPRPRPRRPLPHPLAPAPHRVPRHLGRLRRNAAAGQS